MVKIEVYRGNTFFFYFGIWLKNIDCVYLLEPLRGGTNDNQQVMFVAKIMKISSIIR